jgi:L-ascorbate metabolism protein UlaG (beta-lactamase superfamily)
MMLPEDIPIVVPDCHPDHMWEVDLSALIRSVLGRRRKVICLKHDETIAIGDIRATALPSFGETPSSLKTFWNCYLFETDNAAVACAADAAITDESVDFLLYGYEGNENLSCCALD